VSSGGVCQSIDLSSGLVGRFGGFPLLTRCQLAGSSPTA
jgi:hypothetical protein